MYTSEHLEVGKIYSRKDLRAKFNISDATIKNGVFKPKDHESIWLFVTQKKTPDRTQYIDNLDGDSLAWDGQSAGRTDNLIINHKKDGNELLLFYRVSRYQYIGSGFEYKGRLNYEKSSGGKPSHFILKRVSNNNYIDGY
jgi:hypothetical protein